MYIRLKVIKWNDTKLLAMAKWSNNLDRRKYSVSKKDQGERVIFNKLILQIAKEECSTNQCENKICYIKFVKNQSEVENRCSRKLFWFQQRIGWVFLYCTGYITFPLIKKLDGHYFMVGNWPVKEMSVGELWTGNCHPDWPVPSLIVPWQTVHWFAISPTNHFLNQIFPPKIR